MEKNAVALVAGATPEEFEQLKECLPDWECLNAPLNDEDTGITMFNATADLLIVYARKAEQNTVALCEHLRSLPGTSAAPILLIVSRYAIIQTYPVRRMGHATFIITPFDAKNLLDRIAEIYDLE